ncbi:MAG: AAA family ATPase [Anaerolineaceae bacterium]
MIPYRLTIQGFLSYQEPATLEFESFDLACIAGVNGAGKSSLLDAITWALFGQARRRDDALINVHAKAAEVVYDFYYEDELYRVQRSKTRDKITILEFYVRDGNGEWKVLTEKSVRETEARLQQTLHMDYETFTNASFFLQGKADQFATQKPADRKRILSSILGLEVWDSYREGAADRRKTAEMDLAADNRSLAELEAELGQEDERKARLAQLESALKQQSDLRQAKEALLEAQTRQEAALDEQRRMLEVLNGQVETDEAQLQQAEERLQSLTAEKEDTEGRLARADEISAAYEAWQKQQQELRRWEEVAVNFRAHDQKRTEPLTRIAEERSRLAEELRGLTVLQKDLLTEESRLPELLVKIEEFKKQSSTLHTQLDTRPALEARMQEILGFDSQAKAENDHLKVLMAELKERIDRLNQTEGAECPLCGQPLSSPDRTRLVADLEKEGKNLGDRFRANQDIRTGGETEKKELENQIASLQQAELDLRALTRTEEQLSQQESQVRRQLSQWESGGKLRMAEIEKLLTEENFALDARQELQQVDEDLKELGYDSAAHDAARKAEQSGRANQEEMRALEIAGAALEPLKREIKNLEGQVKAIQKNLSSHQKIYDEAAARFAADSANMPDLSQAAAELRALQEEENRIRMQMGAAHQEVQILETLRQRQVDFKVHRDELTLHISQLKMLEKAFGKDGVPALLIEEALPDIEKHANDILDSLTSGGMSVSFHTQRDYKDKAREDQKETLDIVISDAAGPREYEMFSGGESFRVNFAIRLALSRVLAQRAGARLQTLVIDEGFGSQDQEGRQRLIETINQVRPDFAKVLVITHLTELIDAFPARIIVDKTPTGSRIRVENS